ncbi:hypothetical protein [uncultured Campylobacter sp.]|uniref:hypothetical protein n=1 Tax=uncultured Campylobacter sp. TaxID=218934 RepID=UPI0026313AAF|nr:hypothetical protein [uncultured Campylobacter sp.]
MRNFNVSLRETPRNSARYRIMRGIEFRCGILKTQNFIQREILRANFMQHGILWRKIPRGMEFMEFAPPQNQASADLLRFALR